MLACGWQGASHGQGAQRAVMAGDAYLIATPLARRVAPQQSQSSEQLSVEAAMAAILVQAKRPLTQR